MIAYNPTWVYNLHVTGQSDDAFDAGCITTEEKTGIHAAHSVGFYTPNIFIRVGLFLLTVVISGFSFALLALITGDMISSNFGGMLIFYGLVSYAALEHMIRNKHHYHSGVDDALLWMSAIMIFSGITYSFSSTSLLTPLLACGISLFYTIRFANRLMALCMFLSLVYFVFMLCYNIGGIIKAIVPFVMMAVTAGIYFFNRSLARKENLLNYRGCFTIVEIAALLCFYIAGNYFVVRELSNMMFNMNLQEGQTIPFGLLFWTFTILIPAIYIATGLKRKDVVLLRCGLLLVAAMIFTIRYYYDVMAVENVMVVGGIALILIVYALIRYLKTPKHGFTYEELQSSKTIAPVQLESLVIAETFATQPAPESGTQFGGGSFGGGGAGNEF